MPHRLGGVRVCLRPPPLVGSRLPSRSRVWEGREEGDQGRRREEELVGDFTLMAKQINNGLPCSPPATSLGNGLSYCSSPSRTWSIDSSSASNSGEPLPPKLSTQTQFVRAVGHLQVASFSHIYSAATINRPFLMSPSNSSRPGPWRVSASLQRLNPRKLATAPGMMSECQH